MGIIGYIIIVLALILILNWVWKTLNWVWFTPKRLEKHMREQGLKGNPYKLLYGDTKEILSMRNQATEKPISFKNNDHVSRIFPFLCHQINTYGENCWTWQGPVPIIHVQAPELMKDALSRMNEFIKPKLNPLIDMLVPGVFSYEGEKWTKHRRLINPAFHVEKLKFMLPAIGTSVSEMANKLEKRLSESGSAEVDVWPYMTSLSADALSRAAFGSSYIEGCRIFELLKDQIQIIMRDFYSFQIPGWRFVPTETNRKMNKINSEIQTLLTGLIDKRKKAMEAGEAAKDDLLGILLDSDFKASRSNNNVGGSQKQQTAMTFQDIIDECKLFYFAGQETTSVLLGWTMVLLSKHQDWQTRAREEVLATFGKNQPDIEGLSRLKIVTMILYEVLRLFPPVIEVSRAIPDRETKLGNILVPAGSVVSLSILHTHHDKRLWGDDAHDFKPDRFAEGVAKATKGKMAYFPFGWGPRICVGQNFAIAEARMAVSMILQRFVFELSPSYTHAPTTILTLQPQFGAHLIIHPLQS